MQLGGRRYYDPAEDIDLNIEPDPEPTFYFYKRWLWLIFPWACLSIDQECIFSDVIAKCFSSDTRYMSVRDEQELTHQAQIIAIEAKIKKKLVLQSRKEDYLINPSIKKPSKLLNELESKMQGACTIGMFSGDRNDDFGTGSITKGYSGIINRRLSHNNVSKKSSKLGSDKLNINNSNFGVENGSVKKDFNSKKQLDPFEGVPVSTN